MSGEHPSEMQKILIGDICTYATASVRVLWEDAPEEWKRFIRRWLHMTCNCGSEWEGIRFPIHCTLALADCFAEAYIRNGGDGGILCFFSVLWKTTQYNPISIQMS
jgi:hypothetical protein